MVRLTTSSSNGYFSSAHCQKVRKEKERRKQRKRQKGSSHHLRKRGHLGRIATSPEKNKAFSEDQEGCGQQASLAEQTSPY